MPLSFFNVIFSGKAMLSGLNATGDASQLYLIHVLPPLDSVSPGTLPGQITDDTRLQKADLTVSPLHACHGMKHRVPGRVAVREIRHAKCRLLVLRSHDVE